LSPIPSPFLYRSGYSWTRCRVVLSVSTNNTADYLIVWGSYNLFEETSDLGCISASIHDTRIFWKAHHYMWVISKRWIHTCSTVSLMTIPPEDTLCTKLFFSFSLLVKRYAVRGFGFEFIRSILSFTFSTYQITNKMINSWSVLSLIISSMIA
jgi:hypothetical protein